MFQPICKPASTKTHIKKQHITGAPKDGKFPFRDSQKKSKSTATKMIKFGVFPELDKEKKMCVDVNTVYKPESGCFLIISPSD